MNEQAKSFRRHIKSSRGAIEVELTREQMHHLVDVEVDYIEHEESVVEAAKTTAFQIALKSQFARVWYSPSKDIYHIQYEWYGDDHYYSSSRENAEHWFIREDLDRVRDAALEAVKEAAQASGVCIKCPGPLSARSEIHCERCRIAANSTERTRVEAKE